MQVGYLGILLLHEFTQALDRGQCNAVGIDLVDCLVPEAQTKCRELVEVSRVCDEVAQHVLRPSAGLELLEVFSGSHAWAVSHGFTKLSRRTIVMSCDVVDDSLGSHEGHTIAGNEQVVGTEVAVETTETTLQTPTEVHGLPRPFPESFEALIEALTRIAPCVFESRLKPSDC